MLVLHDDRSTNFCFLHFSEKTVFGSKIGVGVSADEVGVEAHWGERCGEVEDVGGGFVVVGNELGSDRVTLK